MLREEFYCSTRSAKLPSDRLLKRIEREKDRQARKRRSICTRKSQARGDLENSRPSSLTITFRGPSSAQCPPPLRLLGSRRQEQRQISARLLAGLQAPSGFQFLSSAGPHCRTPRC